MNAIRSNASRWISVAKISAVAASLALALLIGVAPAAAQSASDFRFDAGRWADWWMSPDTNVLAGDFDNDGRTDVMKFDNGSPGGVWVGLARGNGTAASPFRFDGTKWADWWMSPDTNVLAGDFDNDGRTDVMKFDNGSPGGVWVGLARGNGTAVSPFRFDTTKWADWWMSPDTNVLAGDFDNDGRTDVMKFDNGSPGGVWVGLARGNGTAASPFRFEGTRWADWWMSPDTNVLAGDFDNDGRTDVMKFDNGRPAGVWVGLARGNGTAASPFRFEGTRWADWWMSPDTNVLAGDFDNDGRTDVMKFDNGRPAGVWVGLARGNGTAASPFRFEGTRWADWWMSPDTNVLAGDFDNDGRTDVMKFDNGRPAGVWVGLARGNGAAANPFRFDGARWADWWMSPDTNVLAGDFDNDGFTDVMKFDNGRPAGVWVGLTRAGNFAGPRTFTGAATLVTANTRAAGPFTQNLSFGLELTTDGRTVTVTAFPPIVVGPFGTPLGNNTTTIRMIGGGTGSFDPSTGAMELPMTLEFDHSLFLIGDSDADCTLTTGTSSSPGSAFTGTGARLAPASGTITLVCGVRFSGGFLGGDDGFLTVTGTIAPAP